MVGAQPLEALPEAPRRETDKVAGPAFCGSETPAITRARDHAVRGKFVCLLPDDHTGKCFPWDSQFSDGMAEEEIRQWRADMIASLAMWRDPDGFLLPTETEPEERERIRERLATGIEVLNRVLGGAA